MTCTQGQERGHYPDALPLFALNCYCFWEALTGLTQWPKGQGPVVCKGERELRGQAQGKESPGFPTRLGSFLLAKPRPLCCSPHTRSRHGWVGVVGGGEQQSLVCWCPEGEAG
jgi:hypothetical protein